MLYNFTKVQDEETKEIKKYFVNGREVSDFYFNNTFDDCNADQDFKYCNSVVKQNIKTGDYIHTSIFLKTTNRVKV